MECPFFDARAASARVADFARVGGPLARWVPDYIINCSLQSARLHARFGYDAAEGGTIPNGYDAERFRPDEEARAATRKSLGTEAGTFLICTIGRWHAQKGFPELLEAVRLLRGRNVPARLLMVGRELDERNVELTDFIERSGCGEFVQQIGERADIPDIARAPDLHVLASIGAEAFPNVVAETMLSGTPNVVTEVGDAAFIVGDTGWTVAPGDADRLAGAIEQAYDEWATSPDGWRKRREAARQRIADNFTLDRMVEAYKQVWRQVADKRGGSAAAPPSRSAGPVARSVASLPSSNNLELKTVAGFGREWDHFDQSKLVGDEYDDLFSAYFGIFPFDQLPKGAEGFDLGCGSGRWAAGVAPRVGKLHLIDPAEQALDVARKRLAGAGNVVFHLAPADAIPLADGSQDFGYSLGVLHHIPNTGRALADAVRKLKPGAPFLLYIYYKLENRPAWFRLVWHGTDAVRRVISRLPFPVARGITSAIAGTVYWPLARLSLGAEKAGLDSIGHSPERLSSSQLLYRCGPMRSTASAPGSRRATSARRDPADDARGRAHRHSLQRSHALLGRVRHAATRSSFRVQRVGGDPALQQGAGGRGHAQIRASSDPAAGRGHRRRRRLDRRIRGRDRARPGG